MDDDGYHANGELDYTGKRCFTMQTTKRTRWAVPYLELGQRWRWPQVSVGLRWGATPREELELPHESPCMATTPHNLHTVGRPQGNTIRGPRVTRARSPPRRSVSLSLGVEPLFSSLRWENMVEVAEGPGGDSSGLYREQGSPILDGHGGSQQASGQIDAPEFVMGEEETVDIVGPDGIHQMGST